MRGPDDQVELFVDVLSLPLRGVSICQTDGGDPSQTPDFEFMRAVAEAAVPVLYAAGYQLAAIDGSRIIPLDREKAVGLLAVSIDDFGVLGGEHSA